MLTKKIKILLSLLLFLIALIFKFPNIWINNTLYIISYILVGFDIIIKALKNMVKGQIFDENFLMMIATFGAFVINKFPEAVAVMLFYQIGELFQDYALDKSKKSLSSLLDIRPTYANILEKENIKKVLPQEVKVNDLIIIKPGEKVPLDGILIEGNSLLDTKALTGEALPKEVTKGDNILSGCVNLNGVIKVKVTKEYNLSTVSQILSLVENINRQKAKSEKFITKFARYYTPMVVFSALFIALVIPLITHQSFYMWLYRALTFLVVSCPCALVISIPLSFFSGIGKASKMGILIKGSNSLENLTQVKTIVFDKTGTLTKGSFAVQKVVPVNISKEELLEIATLAENYSSHPIAMALKKAYKKKIDVSKIKNVQELSGYGVKAKINKREVIVGNEKLMLENKIDFPKCLDVGTCLYVAIDNIYQGYILISDEIKKRTFENLKELRNNHIEKIIMFTGDQEGVSKKIAQELEIDKYYAGLLPQVKVTKMQKLLNPKSKVAFVGDGLNDAPVLATADVGIAMGKLGTDSAIEAADIVIMTDELAKINDCLKIAHKTMQVVKENIIFAISIKFLVLLLALLGISSMWEAVFADVGVSILAILNALRILFAKKI